MRTIAHGLVDTKLVDVAFDYSGLERRRAKVTASVRRSARTVVSANTRAAEKALEDATRRAVPGKNGPSRLWRAWASNVFPKAGLSDNPAGSIYVRGGERSQGAMRAHTEGARIVGKQSQWLAIPLPAAGARMSGRGRAQLTPREWEQRTGRKLRFVYRRGKPALLVADDARLSARGVGRARAQGKKMGPYAGRGASTVPIFVLVPQVTITGKFSIQRTLAPFEDRLRRDFRAEVKRIAAEK